MGPLALSLIFAAGLGLAACGGAPGAGGDSQGLGQTERESAAPRNDGTEPASVPVWQRPGPMSVPERLALIGADTENQFIWWRLPGLIEGLRKDAGAAGEPKAEMTARMRLGIALTETGNAEEAIVELRRAIQLSESLGLRKDSAEVRGVRFWLAMACLREGEQDNCLALHGPDSCLMPIAGGGVHRNTRGSSAAIPEFEALLADQPESLGHRWLLNLAYQTLGQYPDGVPPQYLIPPRAFESEYDIKRFPNVAGERGVTAMTDAGGAILEDFDLDGDLDILLSTIDVRGSLRLLLNDGRGAFTDATERAGLSGELGGECMEDADYDNDGDVDVFVTRGGWMGVHGRHPNSLLRNDGDGTFTDVTIEAGLLSFHPTQQSDWGDFDNDGWLDLYVGNESFGGVTEPCELFHNRGDGTFEEIAAKVGLAHSGFVKGVVWGDIDNDGRLDLYLSQANEKNVLFHNDGPVAGADGAWGWRFTDITERAGVGNPVYSYPAMFFDYNNDGWLDLFVSSWLSPDQQTESPAEGAGEARKARARGVSQHLDSSPILDSTVQDALGLPFSQETPCLYRNNHDGTFTDVAKEMHIAHPLMGMGMNFGDLDNDGWLDFYVGTGNPSLSSLVPNRMFRNDGGRRFQDVTTSGGFGTVQKGHAVAWGDIDGDGDQDILEQLGGTWTGDVAPKALFLNPGHGNHWVTLRLQGTKSNRFGVDSRIEVVVATPSGDRSIFVTAGSGGSFGCSSLQQEIGLGDATSVRRVVIRWPSGDVRTIANVPMDRVLSVREGESVARQVRAFARVAARS